MEVCVGGLVHNFRILSWASDNEFKSRQVDNNNILGKENALYDVGWSVGDNDRF